jgi:hypothetical protein
VLCVDEKKSDSGHEPEAAAGATDEQVGYRDDVEI